MASNIKNFQLPKMNFMYPLVIAILFILISSSFVTVDSGHVGVILTLKAVQPEPLSEGFHFKKPFVDQIIEMDIRLAKAYANAAAASIDLQTVKTQVTVQYSLTGSLAPVTYQRVWKRNVVAETIIDPAIQESVKAITAKYTAEQLVTKRAEENWKFSRQLSSL